MKSIRRHVTVLVVTVVAIVGAFLYTLVGSGDRPVLGLDLQGGISIVLFPEEGQDLSALDTAADIIRNRVDALGIAEPEISRVGDTIVVDLPGVKERDQAEALVGQTAELRFRVVELFWPHEGFPDGASTTAPGDPSSTTSAPAGETTTTAPTADETSTTVDGEAAGAAISAQPISAVRPVQDTDTTVPSPPPPDETTATSTTVPVTQPDPTQTCDDLITPREERAAEATVWLPGADVDGNGRLDDGCYLLGPTIITGRNIGDAEGVYDPSQGSYVVNVTFKNDDFIAEVATPYVGREVAIELDGVVQSAPTINPGINTRDVVITGAFGRGEARDLALVLRYGSLPVQFDEEEKTVQSVSPTLGKDQLRAGIVAGVIGIALVMFYMVLYYRLLGFVVWVGLGLTALIFFTITSWLSVNQGLTLTLAGVTGLIVSVGVTVDSYVVYFERLKDEVRTGKTVRSSLDTGFQRAFRTILAADLVSLLGAAVLYLLAEGSVRGFAFFLGLSTVIDLVISYFVMYPLVVLISRRPGLLRMRGIGVASGLDVAGVRA